MQGWKDKIAAGFYQFSQPLFQLALFAMQMGMLWVGVGDPLGNNWSGGSVIDTTETDLG